MTRKISKQEKQRRKFAWMMRQIAHATTNSSLSLKDATDAFIRLGIVLGGKPPAYNWPETPERSRMHSLYARKKGRR